MFSHNAAATYLSPLHERARRQLDTYWRVRVTKTIESLEREARRMLQLECQLAGFSEEYYGAVGPWAEYLAALEAQFEAPVADYKDDVETLPLALAQRELKTARETELKARYRTLAKEIHPDRLAGDATGEMAEKMHAVNDAYGRGDLAALLKCEAEILMGQLCGDWSAAECYLRDIERAVETYAAGYRALLNSPLNHLMLRSLAAKSEGWDWIGTVIGRLQRAVATREETLRGGAEIAVA